MISNVTKKYTVALTLVLFFSVPCWAHRHHDAHVHGVANVNVAIDQNDVEIELESPAINVVGFEHNPQDKDELEHAQKALKEMENGGDLFIFSPSAKCELVKVKIDSDMELSLHHDGEGAHHEDEHNEKAHHDGEEAHQHHADIDGEYHFFCVDPENLEELQIKLFDNFHDLHKVKVQVISKDKQTGAELTPENNSVVF